jgi:hypothetical protein
VDVWTNHANEIEEWHATVNKPVIFTEIGYRSGNGTSMAPSNFWSHMAIDLQEQRDCYEAAFQTLWDKSWFYGFYWWTWMIENHGGPDDASHTPQNKPAQDVITQWYSKSRQVAVIDQTFTSTQRTSVGETQTVAFHASWEHDNTNVADAKVYVNGTEYTTNSSGWISFNYVHNFVGKQVWTVTDFSHPQATTYKMTAENPYIIWDKLDVDVQVGSFMLGATTVRTEIRYASDNTLVTGATTKVNGQLSPETETGIYVTELVSWSPYHELTIQVDIPDLPQQTQTTSTVHNANTILYAGTITAIAIILFMILKHKTKTATNPDETQTLAE